MGLQFLLGRSGSGKTEYLLNSMRQELLNAPLGHPLIYIVPEQMTFQSEYALVQTPGLEGMMRAQVYSFTRLAWRILQEVGGISRYHVDQTGIHMMLKKIIEHQKEELRLFANSSEQAGFIEELEKMVKEFKQYTVDAPSLEEMKNIPVRIGIASGEKKASSVLGAIKGNLINVLITNAECARHLLGQSEEQDEAN
ncbi:MAG: sugar-binding domain-containing protein [Priestia megaterium]